MGEKRVKIPARPGRRRRGEGEARRCWRRAGWGRELARRAAPPRGASSRCESRGLLSAHHLLSYFPGHLAVRRADKSTHTGLD